MYRIFLILTAVIFLIGAAALAFTPGPTLKPTSTSPVLTSTPISASSVVFLSDRDGTIDLYVTDQTGTVRRLTQSTEEEQHPAVRPDGSAVVYTARRGRLWATRLVRIAERRVDTVSTSTLEPTGFVFAPDGGALLATETQGSASRVLLTAVPSGPTVALASDATAPFWFPSGDALGYLASTPDGTVLAVRSYDAQAQTVGEARSIPITFRTALPVADARRSVFGVMTDDAGVRFATFALDDPAPEPLIYIDSDPTTDVVPVFRGVSLVYLVTRAHAVWGEVWRALPDGRDPARVTADVIELNVSADGTLAVVSRADGVVPFIETWDVASGTMQTRVDGAWLTVR